MFMFPAAVHTFCPRCATAVDGFEFVEAGIAAGVLPTVPEALLPLIPSGSVVVPAVIGIGNELQTSRRVGFEVPSSGIAPKRWIIFQNRRQIFMRTFSQRGPADVSVNMTPGKPAAGFLPFAFDTAVVGLVDKLRYCLDKIERGIRFCGGSDWEI